MRIRCAFETGQSATCWLLQVGRDHFIPPLSFPESAALGTSSSKESNKARHTQLALAAEMQDWRRLMLLLEAAFHVTYLCLIRRPSLPPKTSKNMLLKSPTTGILQAPTLIQQRVKGQLERCRHGSKKTFE